jgi:iron(III) transport system permease protein
MRLSPFNAMRKATKNAPKRIGGGALAQPAAMSAMTGVMLLLIIAPVAVLFSRALFDTSGNFIGFKNFAVYLSTPAMSVTVRNSIYVSAVTMVISTVLGYGYAYALTRTNIRGKTFFRYIALIPIFMPTMTHGIGLVYLLGKKGLLTMLGFGVELYGPLGIILAEVVYTFPQAFMMLYVSLSYADGRLYEASETLGAGALRRFLTVTLPGTRYTVVNTMFVCFTLAFTDFGAPKVLGGNFGVLATDIYKQVIGQFNIPMGAVVGTFLLIPSLIAFAADRVAKSRYQDDGITAKRRG